MSVRKMFAGCLIAVVILLMGYEYTRAAPQAGSGPVKIGVVNVLKIFRDCRKSAKYNAQVLAEQAKTRAQITKLDSEIEAGKKGLSALKPGSSDYLIQIKDLMEKQSHRETIEEFTVQERALKYQRFVEDLYTDVLRHTADIAGAGGFDLVIEKDEVDFPSPSVDSAMLSIRTHKVMYSGGCVVDITSEVKARLDAEADGSK